MTHARHSEFTGLLLLVLSLAVAGTPDVAAAANKIYKWVDQNGDAQYTQMPPPAGVQVIEIRNAPPPADDPEAERARMQQETENLDERMQERKASATKAEVQAQNKEIRRKNCHNARKNLAELQQGGIKRYLTPDGEVLRLTEEDRQQRIAETRAHITEFCTD